MHHAEALPPAGGAEAAALVFAARLPPADIGYLNMLFESYEGLAIVRTVDAKAGEIEFWVPAGRREEFLSAAASLAAELGLMLGSERPWRAEDAG